MRKIRNPEFAADVLRIRNVLELNGYEVSLTEAEELWEKYSGKLDAGWLNLPSEDRALVDDLRGENIL